MERRITEIQVWINPSDLEKYNNGEVIKSSIWENSKKDYTGSMKPIKVLNSHVFSMYSNGYPYLKNTPWTWEEMDSFRGL